MDTKDLQVLSSRPFLTQRLTSHDTVTRRPYGFQIQEWRRDGDSFVKHGVERRVNDNGFTIDERTWNCNKQVGRHTQFYVFNGKTYRSYFCDYENGKKHGFEKHFVYFVVHRPSGPSMIVPREVQSAVYRNGFLNGFKRSFQRFDRTAMFSKVGPLETTTSFVFGLKHGNEIVRNLKTGRIVSERQFDGGQPFGTRTDYFSNGKVRRIVVYSDGVDTVFFKNGSISRHKQYRDGMGATEAVEHTFTDQGQVRTVREFRNNQRHGTWEFTNVFGTCLRRQRFRNGLKHGLEEHFYEHGCLKSLEPFVRGLKHGLAMHFSTNGALLKTTQYDRGQLIK